MGIEISGSFIFGVFLIKTQITMKTTLFYLLSICFLLLFNCCGSDEEVNPDDQLIGTWKGSLTQPVFGVLETNLNITSLNMPSSSGNRTFSTSDLSNCDAS
ncbi:MAG: hypothetical protein ACI9FN_000742 [Saprospiraceae bacterium]|jgi:hypothetical protein